MTVYFLVREASAVVVFWTKEGERQATQTPAESIAIPGTPWNRWNARLTGLKPGTPYHYRVHYTLADTGHQSEIYRFLTPDPAARKMKAAFNDIHDHRETITAVMAHVKPSDYDFTIFNGHMINDPSPKDGARHVLELWNFYVGLLEGHSKPIIFVLGNHEFPGGFTNRLPYLFDLPNLTLSDKPQDLQWQFEMPVVRSISSSWIPARTTI